MRWWLGLAFAAVAALTAVAVVSVLNSRSEHAFRRYAEEFAVGNSVAASETLKRDTKIVSIQADAASIARHRHLALWVFAADGSPLTPRTSNGLSWSKVPHGIEAKRAALGSNRYIHGRKDGSALVIGLPIHKGAGAALVAYSLRPDLRDQLGIVRNEFFQAAMIAFAVGAALGLLIATLTARRLARIARAASAIGGGDFSVDLKRRFPDEVGSLALSIDSMRGQLQELFLALERDRARLERLLDRLGDGVLVVDRALTVEFANDRTHELLGPTERLDEGPLHRLALALFATGIPVRMRIADDDQILEVSGIPPGEGGDNAIIVVRDESQRERNERTQREFATNAAHELRTPLASIVTAVEMLQTGAKDEPEARDEFLEVIAREAARLTRLTRALLVLARAEVGDEAPRAKSVPVARLLEQVASSLRPREGVEVGVDCPPALAIAGDAELLEQAVSSVASNAVQYTSSGSVMMRGRGENGSVVIEVADTGSGIAPRDQRRIFERFYRAGDRDGSFGLGLSIAREAVGALGGEIALDSEVSVGTTVRITLARAEGEASL
jgi:two-component system phosphate regulon sensor histidine kinase PhoR